MRGKIKNRQSAFYATLHVLLFLCLPRSLSVCRSFPHNSPEVYPANERPTIGTHTLKASRPAALVLVSHVARVASVLVLLA